MENPLKNKGFRSFIIKILLFLLLIIAIQLLVGVIFSGNTFYKKYLSVPKEVLLELPNIRTILINAFLFGIVSFIILSYKRLLKIPDFRFKKIQIVFLISSAVIFFLKYYFNFLVNKNTAYFLQLPIFWGVVKILINILFVLVLALAIFGLDFIKYFLKNYKKEILWFCILSIVFFFLMLLVQNLWTVFSGVISKILYYIFSLFFNNVTYRPYVVSFTMQEGGGPLLGINSFRAIVGKPCSGIDSFLLFTSLYALIFIMDYKKLNKTKAIVTFVVGAIGMFLVNLIRIFLLFIVGAYIDAKFAVGLFHTNVGWILFIIYFFVFWTVTSKFVYKK
jgi:exosortase/archaeosortase family protein